MNCIQCGKKNIGNGISNGKFCSQKCKWTWTNNNRKLKPNVAYECIVCGKMVEKYVSPSRIGKDAKLMFCSRKCKGKYLSGEKHPMWNGGKNRIKQPPKPNKPNFKGICEFCGTEFETYRSHSSQPPRFCSIQCIGYAQQRENNPAYNGGRYKCNGYYVVFSPDHPFASKKNLVLEHRLIMEKKIGRYLTEQEVVHHIDRDKTNNDPDNLMLFKNNSEHIKFHSKENGNK